MEFPRLWAHRRAFAKLLEIVDNDERSAGEATFDHPAISILRAECHGIYVNRVVRADSVNLLLALKFRDRDLRNQNRAMENLGFSPYPSKLAGSKDVARIRKDAAMRIAPVWEFNCRSTKTTWPFCG